jgi:hypothetical protein
MMVKPKWSLEELASHLELVAEGNDVIARFIRHSIDDLDEAETSREKTLQAARALKRFAPFQEEIRAFLIELEASTKGNS